MLSILVPPLPILCSEFKDCLPQNCSLYNNNKQRGDVLIFIYLESPSKSLKCHRQTLLGQTENVPRASREKRLTRVSLQYRLLGESPMMSSHGGKPQLICVLIFNILSRWSLGLCSGPGDKWDTKGLEALGAAVQGY